MSDHPPKQTFTTERANDRDSPEADIGRQRARREIERSPCGFAEQRFCLVKRVGSQICWGPSDGVADE